MSNSGQQPANLASLGLWEPRRLDESTYTQAEPIERATLKMLAAEIEIEREHLRLELGKAHRWPGGLPPAWLDQVDRLSWEELLLRYPLRIFDRCGKLGFKARDLLQLVRAHCAPSNPDAIFWMWTHFCAIDDIEPIAVNATLQATSALRSHLGEQEKARRSKQALGAANRHHSRPGGAREKREKLIALWASGKFTTRDICAEQEYQAIGFKSFDTARKVLQGTGDPPPPWVAKNAKK